MKPMKILSISGRIALTSVLALVDIAPALIVYFSIAYSPEYVRRSRLSGPETVYDYRIFPERPLQASPNVFHFTHHPDEARVCALFNADPQVKRVETFLIDTGTQAFIGSQKRRHSVRTLLQRRPARLHRYVVFDASSFDSALVDIAIYEGYTLMEVVVGPVHGTALVRLAGQTRAAWSNPG